MGKLFALLALLTASAAAGAQSEAHRRLTAADEATRKDVLRQLVAASGESCGKVTRYMSTLPSGHDNESVWSVACTGGKSYSVSIYPNGTARVLTCAEVRLLFKNKLDCFQPIR
jgi:hypothetical protein